MASSDAGTSSGSAGGGHYQVFLNFHGQDTRVGFTSFLYRDLTKNGIHSFMDDEELRVGKEIGEELLRAIDDSRIYIPIFSKNYADSKWCLRELARMVNNTTTKSEEKKIMPVFYDVEPDDVALKTPLYRATIEKHKKEFPHEAESWEGALKKVDKIKGWVLPKCKNQAELVDLVVEKVLQELKIKYKFVTEDLVGLDDRVAEVLKLLDVDCNDEVRLLGIHGMGGIGKTTIAGVIYNELSSRFGKHCAFLDAVRETSKKDLVSLQKKLLKDIDSYGAVDTINDVDHGRRRIEATLGSKKVLIVLDDVDEKKQIENLIGQHRLHPGTRIIITTRNTSVLEFTKQRMAPKTKEVNFDPAIRILPYEMVAMNFYDALQLFKRHAFREDSLATDFDNLSRDIVSTIGCLPLALEVIGSSLHGEHKAKWEDALNKLKKVPDELVQEKLMISYNDLNCGQHEIFLDVACFFINEDITNAKYMWQACEFYPELEIDVLVKKSLIKINDDNKFWMHNQLRDLGREIVRQQSPKNLEKRCRLWTSEEVLDLVKIEERCGDVEALDLRGQGWDFDISISPGRFESLRFLRLSKVDMHGDFIVSLSNLRWISWCSPFEIDRVPSMHSKNLVVLELFENYFTDDSKVWDLIKMAAKLKNLTLVECHGITRTPDLSKYLHLERLTFDDCEKLKEIDNSINRLSCLSTLDLMGCNKITELPELPTSLVHLRITSCSLQVVPNLSKLTNLVELVLSDGSNGQDSSNLKHTCHLGWIGKLSKLKKLELCLLNIAAPPTELGFLSLLKDLTLFGLDLQPLNQLPPSLHSLKLVNFNSIGLPQSNLKILSKLTLQHSRLQEIQLRGFSQLQDLKLIRCKLQSLSIPSSLRKLSVYYCPNVIKNGVLDVLASLEELSICGLESIGTIVLCGEGGSLGVLDQLESSSSESTYCSPGVLLLPNSLGKLKLLWLSSCETLLEIQVIGTLLSLQRIYIRNCYAMEKLTGISNLKKLRKLDISWCCKLQFVEGLDKLEFLTSFRVKQCPSPDALLDISNSKMPDDGIIRYMKSLDSRNTTFKDYKEMMVQLLAPQPKTNKEKDAEKPNTKLPLWFHPFASSQDHYISEELPWFHPFFHPCASSQDHYIGEELPWFHPFFHPFASSQDHYISEELPLWFHQFPPIDNVKEETLPGNQNQNQTRQQDLNLLSISPLSSTKLQFQFHPSVSSRDHEINEEPPIDDVREGTPPGNQSQTREQDSNPQSNSPLLSTELQLQFHPSGSRDHEINQESPIDDVREGTLPGNQNQTREQDSNPQSNSPLSSTELQLQFRPSGSRDHEINEESPIDDGREGTLPGNQNRTREPDSKPQSLDELARPRTFSDNFKTCLVSILECVCNGDCT